MKRIWLTCALCALLTATAAWARTFVSPRTAAGRRTAPVAHVAQTPTYSFLFGDRSIEPGRGDVRGGTARAFRFTGLAAGTARSISMLLARGSRAKTLVAGVYADAGGHPGSLLGSGSLSHPKVRTWDTVSVRRPFSVTGGAAYWIVVLGKGGAVHFRYRNQASCLSQRSRKRRMKGLPGSWRGVRMHGCPVSA